MLSNIVAENLRFDVFPPWPSFLTAFGLTLLLTPVVRVLARRWGCVSLPRSERWHRRPTPFLGGAAFFPGFFLSVLVFSSSLSSLAPLLVIAAQMFLLGFYDDFRHLNPTTKLIGQIITAATALFCGYTFHFFTWLPLDLLLTAVWIIGLTNALNLLDNMDGLASGIAFIAALYLGALFYQDGDRQHLLASLSLAGAIAGFLCYNFHPASIFMGDGGSLFLGAVLSLLTLHTQGQASNIFSLVAVPALILLVPIFDVALVTFTRILRGQPVSQGGRDHSSHRLVVLGLSEPKAVLLLYLMAVIAGGAALLIESFSYTLSFVLIPLVLLIFALFTAYLAQVELLDAQRQREQAAKRKLTAVLVSLTYKRRLLEVLLDLVLISFTYYLAFVLRFDFSLEANTTALYLTSLPFVLASTYSAFFVCQVYRGVWRHTDLEDLVRFAWGVAGGTLLSAFLLFVFFGFGHYSRVVLILYALLLFLGGAGSRLSFRLFALMIDTSRKKAVPVLIYGAGDRGEVVVQECWNNPALAYRPLGFLDDDLRKQGRVLRGLPILGGAEQLAEVLERKPVQGLIVASPQMLVNGSAEKVRGLCREKNIWIKQFQLSFVEE